VYLLRRVYFDSIGHKDARFDPLVLDFRSDGGQKPLDSVLWLRNMGGKTSMLALIFSVLQPGYRDFLGREKAGEIRQLQKYVLADDIAHVVLEWSSTGDGLLASLEDETILVTGVVMTYRRGQTSELDRHFYAFRSLTGTLSLDELRFRQNGRRVHVRTFLDQITQAQRSRPLLEAVITDKQSDWKATLESLGLDPEIFRYQLAMNEHEAGARKFLGFRDADSFVDFLIKVVMDPGAMNQVAENLGQVADKLAMEPHRKKERDFASGIITRLRPVTDTHAVLREATERQQSLIVEGSRLNARITYSLGAARAEVQEQDERATAYRLARTQHDNDRSRQERLSRALDGRVAQYAVDAARDTLNAAQEIEDETKTEVKISEALPHVIEQRRLTADAAALDRALADQIEGARSDIDAYKAAATLLHRRYRVVAEQARTRVAEGEDRARLAADRREGAEAEIQKATGEIARIDSEADSISGQLQDLDQRQARLRKDGLLHANEPAQTAVERLRRDEASVSSRREQIATWSREIDGRRGTARTAIDELTPQISQLRSKIDSQRDSLNSLLGRTRDLSENQRLRELAEHEDLDILVAGSLVAERLLAALSSTTRQMVEARVAASEDERAKAALDETGFLPAALDVDRAIAHLKHSKVAATPGWQYLAEHVNRDHWPQVISERPWLLTSVVVEPEEGDRAIDALREAGLDPSLLLSIAESGEFHWVERQESPNGHSRHLKTLVTRPALYDSVQAEAARGQVEARLEKALVVEAELSRRRDEDQSLLGRLKQFMADCPPDHLDSLRFEIEELEGEAKRLDELKAAAQATVREATEEIQQLGAEDKRQETDLRRLAGAIPWLENLAELEERAKFARERQREMHSERQTWVQSRQEANEAKASARDNEKSATTLAAAERADAVSWDKQAEAIENFEIEADVDERPLAELEAEHRSRKSIYEEKTSGSEIALRRRALGDRLSAVTTALADFEDVLEAARRRAADPALHSETVRKTRQAMAKRALEAATEARINAKSDVNSAEKFLQSLPTDRRLLTSLPTELEPSNFAQAQEFLGVVQERQRASERLRDQAETQAKEAETARDAAGNKSKVLDAVGSLLAGTLGAHLRELQLIDEPIEDSEATQRAGELTSKWQSVGVDVTDSRIAFNNACSEVKRFASQADFEELAGAYRDRYKDGTDEYLVEHAEADIAELRMRIKWLEKELADLEGHRRTVVLELVTLVEQALRLLHDAQTLRLSEGLGDWTGQQYLRIKYEHPESVEDLKIRLQVLINDLIAQRSRPEGISLLLTAVRAANGNKPFDVQVLKPNDGLRVERAPVGEIVAWSGGQKLTTAILIYCVLIRLRSLNRRGVHDNTDSVLILDNPLGEANLMTLVDLQRTVAAAMRVQLIFATGIDDKSALAPFRNVIRLRNLVDNRTGRKYVTHAQDAPGTDGLTATRVYRRQEVIGS